jgi:type II secretory pathway component PulC
MRKLRWISILLLVLGAAGLGYKLRAEWRAFRAANDPAVIKPGPLASAPPAAAMPPADYSVVAQQNPFHPERNDAMPPPPAVVAKVVGPPPLVYGSMLLGKEKYALMATENDLKPRRVNEGEEFSGYKLAEVKQQSVILEADGSKSEVMFYNALSRLRRETTKTQAPPPTTVQANAATPTLAVSAEPPLPPPNSGAAAPAGKKLVMTPFGPIWQDVKP